MAAPFGALIQTGDVVAALGARVLQYGGTVAWSGLASKADPRTLTKVRPHVVGATLSVLLQRLVPRVL